MLGIFQDLVNWASGPTVLFTISTVGLLLSFRFTRVWTKPAAKIFFAVLAVFYVASMWNENFFLIVAKPDNIPITGVVFLVFFFTWYAMYQGIENDRRRESKEDPLEKQESEKVWVWPDLVYTEMLAMVLLSIVLVVWSILAAAPIEQPANPADSPNPSKAPWYFLGLQEMLVYFDPWLAGVVFPTLIIVGLIAIPYIDTNPKGNGYYTFSERKAEIMVFLFGFLILWCLLVISGTFLRGPNWNFFGPYEYWDVHRVEPLLNVNVSDFFWVKLLGRPLPSGGFFAALVREWLGILMVGFYLFALPVVMSWPRDRFPTGLKWLSLHHYARKMGAPRYYIGVSLFLMMMSLPIKMYLRWAFNLKYVVAFPEIFFNI